MPPSNKNFSKSYSQLSQQQDFRLGQSLRLSVTSNQQCDLSESERRQKQEQLQIQLKIDLAKQQELLSQSQRLQQSQQEMENRKLRESEIQLKIDQLEHEMKDAVEVERSRLREIEESNMLISKQKIEEKQTAILLKQNLLKQQLLLKQQEIEKQKELQNQIELQNQQKYKEQRQQELLNQLQRTKNQMEEKEKADQQQALEIEQQRLLRIERLNQLTRQKLEQRKLQLLKFSQSEDKQAEQLLNSQNESGQGGLNDTQIMMKMLDRQKVKVTEESYEAQKQMLLQKQQKDKEEKLRNQELKLQNVVQEMRSLNQQSQYEKVDVDLEAIALQSEERIEHKQLYLVPIQTLTQLQDEYHLIKDPYKRLVEDDYKSHFNLNWEIYDISDIRTKGQFEQLKEKLSQQQKGQITNLKTLLVEQRSMQSPSQKYISILIEYETEIGAALKYSQCVGDLVATLKEMDKQRESIKYMRADEQNDSKILSNQVAEKLAEIQESIAMYGQGKLDQQQQKVLKINKEFMQALHRVHTFEQMNAEKKRFEIALQTQFK